MGNIGITISMAALKNKPPEKRTKEEEEEREMSERTFGTKDFTMVNRSADFIFDAAWKLTKFEERCDKCGESTGGEAYECNGCQEVLCPDCMSQGHSGANYDEWADEKVVDAHESGFHVGIPQTRAQLADEHMTFASPMDESAGNICADCLEDYDTQEKDAINQANEDMREANEEHQVEMRREPLDQRYTGKGIYESLSQEEIDALTQERIDRLAEKTVDAQMRRRYPDGPFGANFDPMKYASQDEFDVVWNSIRKV